MPARRYYQTPSGYDDSESPPDTTEDDSGKPQPIGVPEDYPIPGAVPGPGQQPIGQGPGASQSSFGGVYPKPTGRYMDGDEWIPANYPGDMLYMLQQQLVKAGLLTNNFTAGVYDPATREAYKNLLALANAAGQDANNTLAQMVQQAQSIPQPTEPLQTQTTDPATLRAVFRRGVIDLRGEGWSRDQINDMVAAYNKLEIQRQTEAFNMQQSGQPGNVQSMPSPEDFIQSQVEQQDPEGVQSEQALDYLSDFLGVATGGQWRGF